MKGDFSRDTFNPARHYTRVLIQQGRVQLDSDANEQTNIILHYLRTLAADLIGPHGCTGLSNADQNFKIGLDLSSTGQLNDLIIYPGRYYVNGLLCENERKIVGDAEMHVTYATQPFYPLFEADKQGEKPRWPDGAMLVYLGGWERLVTSVEDPYIREVALGGPDTAARAQVVWQVRVAPLEISPSVGIDRDTIMETEVWRKIVGYLPDSPEARLRAMALKPQGTDEEEPCIISPESRYRGAENQLYRVEIHRAGRAGSPPTEGETAPTEGATFKWSRENGSVIFPIREYTGGDSVVLEHLGRDERYGLRIGDWVEIVDDDSILRGRVEPLRQVEKLDTVDMVVTFKTGPQTNAGRNPARHPLLRRWDQREGDVRKGGLRLSGGAARVVENASSNPDEGWLALEDGVFIQFQPNRNYRTGDYWLIPARTATGDVEWPRGENNKPLALPLRRVERYYAPLAYVIREAAGLRVHDLRRFIQQAAR